MKTIEDVKALPGYATLKDFLVSAKIKTTVYVDTIYFSDEGIPMLLLVTEDVDNAFDKLYKEIPELLTMGSDMYLGLIPIFYQPCACYEGFALVEEVTCDA